MRRVLVIATVAALAVARPEMYRENEDFQYSRSSSDEGSKSGSYGAQRGNMGGNYERAHNMDELAQHQMGGLVRTVEGDLGNGANQKSGSVFTAASSRGTFGSGHYDLSNLAGRNFQEGETFRDSQSHSSLSHRAGYESQARSHSSTANSAYGSQSQNSRYGYGYNAGNSDQALYATSIQSADNLQSANQHDEIQASHGSGYQTQAGYQGQNVYDQAAASHLSSNAYGTSSNRGTHYRLVGASPVRVYVRPGSTVAIPVAAQSYDASQGSSLSYDQNSQSVSPGFNQNSINSEAERLGTDQQVVYKPVNGAKHYESAYSYRKEWEKHDTVTTAPHAVPTFSPYPANSELYEDSQAQGSRHEASAQEDRNVQSSSHYRGYNTKSTSSRQQAGYNAHAQNHNSLSDTVADSSLASSSAKSEGAYNYGTSANLNSANLNSQVENIGTKPKSYQSSYSYHKSWERQGDPYVIIPSTSDHYSAVDSQASQRLTSSSLNQANTYGSHQHDSHYHQGQQGYSYGADCDESGHIRVARSYNLGHDRRGYQQSRNVNEGQEYASQQSQNLEDLGQRSENLDDLGQQTQNLEDFGQQSQNLEDFSQQSQIQQDFGQQSQNLEDFSQQSQNQQDFGQQSQNLEDLGQQSQNLEDFGQQSQNLENFGQQSQKLDDFGQQTQDAGQLTENFDRVEDLGQQAQNQWDQQSQTDAGQQTQNTWSMHEVIQHGNKAEHGMDHTGFEQESQGSFFEIGNPSLNFTESHTIQEDKPNPFAHTIFEEHLPGQSTELGKDTSHLDLGRQPGQETQDNWQAVFSNDHNNHNSYVPIAIWTSDKARPDVPDLGKNFESHHENINTGYGHSLQHHYQTVYSTNTGTYQTSYNYNPYIQQSVYMDSGYAKPAVYPSSYGHNDNTQNLDKVFTGYGTNPWMLPTLHDHNPNMNPQNRETANEFTNTQAYVTRNNNSTYSTSNVNLSQEPGSSTLNNLWDFLDDIEKQTIPDKDTEISYNIYHDNTEDKQTNNNSYVTQNYTENSFREAQHSIITLPTTTKPNIITTSKPDKLPTYDVERGDIEPEKIKPQEEEGRGDIGPQDNDEITVTKPIVNKTPEDIETLSLTNENNKTTSVYTDNSTYARKPVNLEREDELLESLLGVLSLEEQKKIEHHSEQDNWKLQRDYQRTTTTPKWSDDNVDHFAIEQDKEQNTEQQSYNQVENFEQQNVDNHESTLEHGPDEQNTDQQFDNLGQETEDLNQHNFNKHEDLGQEHQEFDSFGQQSEGFHQENLGDFDQQSENLGQEHENPHNFGQESEGFHQESLGDFGQQSENLGQEHEKPHNFGQESEGFHQESLGDFGQQSENLGQEHQKPNNFGQESEGFHQESLGDFGQQSENVGQEHQQFDNFGQQSENFHPESLGDLGQQSEHIGQEPQQTNNFGQESESFHQESLRDLGQQSENLGQELQIPDFGHQSAIFDQESLRDFGQRSENFGQEHQQIDNFGQQNKDFQQESLGDFGRHEQIPQKPISKENKNIDHHQKEEQLESFGQENENLEQQSQSEDLWKPESEQQQISQVETFVSPPAQTSSNSASAYNKEGRAPTNLKPVVEPEFVTKKTSNIDTPPEPVTEKATFWSKVGSKFTGAKDKVKSWFSSS